VLKFLCNDKPGIDKPRQQRSGEKGLRMIHFIEGKLAEKTESTAVVQVGGVGFQLWISLMTYRDLPKVDEEVKLHTTLILREDDLKLYGFSTLQEREVFQVLLNISGIGPKMALDILSNISIENLANAVKKNEPALLVGIPGIGKKRAEKLMFDLQRVKSTVFLQPFTSSSGKELSLPKNARANEAVDALTALGLRPIDAQRAVAEAVQHLGEDATVEDLIKEGLRRR
jgi:Holliday junction DNA helicase RuvA